MATPDSRGNETLASDGSFCLSGNFRLTNNNILSCGSAVPRGLHVLLCPPQARPLSLFQRRVGGHREGPFPLTDGDTRWSQQGRGTGPRSPGWWGGETHEHCFIADSFPSENVPGGRLLATALRLFNHLEPGVAALCQPPAHSSPQPL